MAQADSTNTTTLPAAQTRRRFFSTAAGGAVALSIAPAVAAPAFSRAQVSRELTDLADALEVAHDAYTATQAAFDREYSLYDAWRQRNPDPRSENRRAWRKWNRRLEKYMGKSGFYAAQDAHAVSTDAFRKERTAVAYYRARDTNEMTFKAACALHYEGKFSGSIIASSLVIDVLVLAGNGSAAAV